MAKPKPKYPRGLSVPQKAKYTKALKKFRAEGKSESYAKRLARGAAKGKTRQSARGHKVREHVERKEKEKAKLGGLTSEQIKTILNWYRDKFNPGQFKDIPTEEQVIDFSRQEGYPAFKQYRKVWDAARGKYLKELDNGTYIPQDLTYLLGLQSNAGAPSEVWLYYH